MAARLFLGATMAWLALLAATAWHPDGLPLLSSSVFRLSSFLCHQQPDRTFHVGAAPWAVCARCLGLYAAAPAGALLALTVRWRPSASSGNFLLLCIAGIPTVVTWVGEHLLGWPISNVIRFAAALPLGAAVAWVIGYTLPDARRG